MKLQYKVNTRDYITGHVRQDLAELPRLLNKNNEETRISLHVLLKQVANERDRLSSTCILRNWLYYN